MTRVLHSGTRNASSWAFRAWLALREQHIEFEERIVDIRVPQRFGNLARIAEFSPPGAVPVLVDGDAVVYDSLAIMEYANDLGDGSLLPVDKKLRAQARALLAWQHSGLSNLCSRLSFESAFHPNRRAMTPAEVSEAKRFFVAIEESLKRHGGPFLVGPISLADLAFVPTVIRIGSHNPPLDDFPRARDWQDALLSRDSVREWMEDARDLPPVLLDDYTT